MPEQQNIEYKSSWHDDYLKWICGFANAQGGKISNSEYQTRNSIPKPTATRDLAELTDSYKILKNTGFGAGSIYEICPERAKSIE